jgi:hypothetical protein
MGVQGNVIIDNNGGFLFTACNSAEAEDCQ